MNRPEVPALAVVPPERLAEALVAVVSGPGAHHVELRGPALPPVCVCGHPNPALVREHADHIRRFLAAVLRVDRAAR